MTLIFNPMLAQRKEDKLKLLAMIQEMRDSPNTQIIALFSLKTGYRRGTIREMWHELEDAKVIEDGRRLVDPVKSERSREAIELINKRRLRASADSKDAGAESQGQEAETPGAQDPGDRPEAGSPVTGTDGHKPGAEHGQDQAEQAESEG